MAPWSDSLAPVTGGIAESGKRRAPSLGLARKILQRNSVCKETTRPECRSQPSSSLVAHEKLTGAHDPQLALQKSGGLGRSMVHGRW